MKKFLLLAAAAFSLVILSSHKTDEGMFPLSELKNINLKKAGLKLKPVELFNPDGVSLIDAIVRVGGCTGSFISPDGLIVTNHHCAFSFVAGISNTQNNFIREGFLARRREEEASAKGLVCKITASYEDVSGKILQGTQNTGDPLQRQKTIGDNIKGLTESENKAHPGLQCEISEMFAGRTYVLFRYKMLKDIRLVYVPGKSIGEYGGERDNWVWPRHSGDFAFLRAYVAPDGSAAEFSLSNVPFKPAKYLKVNPKGVNENDFVFILGYPGRTFRHQPASFYKYHEEYMLKYISELYDWQINWLNERSRESEAQEIRYSARIKSLANVTKNYKGKLQGFRRAGITAKKFKEEKELEDFVARDEKLKQQYGDVIPSINTRYAEILKYAPRNLWYDQSLNMAPLLAAAMTLDNYRQAYYNLKSPAEKQAFKEKNTAKLKTAFNNFASRYDDDFEREALGKMFSDAQKFNADNRIKAADNFSRDLGAAALQSKIATLYNATKLKNNAEMNALIEGDWEKLFSTNDELLNLATELNREVNFYDEEDRKRDSELNLLLARYIDMKSAWKQKQFIPDANATLRFTYGYVRGYSPNDAEWNAPFTTLRGVIEKEDGKEYELLEEIKKLYAARDYGSLMHPGLKDLPVDFLYNLDTTGGNSGSPVMDSKGDLIGVNFDRAFSATINDYAWNESYSRSVAVDIRYVLWVVQKVAKAQFLIDEMGLKI